MGQKVNPIGLRLGINKGWDSVWYASKKNFGNYLIRSPFLLRLLGTIEGRRREERRSQEAKKKLDQ